MKLQAADRRTTTYEDEWNGVVVVRISLCREIHLEEKSVQHMGRPVIGFNQLPSID